MIIARIKPEQTLEVRNAILRPGKGRSECVYPGDSDPDTAHFGAILEDQIVGIVSIYLNSTAKLGTTGGFQIRAMATIESVRGMGIANSLLKEAEAFAHSCGAKYVWANARIEALGFYQKYDYEVASQEFEIEGVGPHKLIIKRC